MKIMVQPKLVRVPSCCQCHGMKQNVIDSSILIAVILSTEKHQNFKKTSNTKNMADVKVGILNRNTFKLHISLDNIRFESFQALAEKEPAKLQEKFNGFDSDKDGNLTDKELKV